MYAGRIACVSHGQYVDGTGRRTDGRTPYRYITISARRGQPNNFYFLSTFFREYCDTTHNAETENASLRATANISGAAVAFWWYWRRDARVKTYLLKIRVWVNMSYTSTITLGHQTCLYIVIIVDIFTILVSTRCRLPNMRKIYYNVLCWRGGAAVGRWTCDWQVAGSISSRSAFM